MTILNLANKFYVGNDIATKAMFGANALSSALTDDMYYQVSSTVFLDASRNTYQEHTGSIESLTPSEVDGPVGTWVSRQGDVFRAPSEAARMTLRETLNGERYLEKSAGQYFVSDDPASAWKFLHDGTTYSLAVAAKAGVTDLHESYFAVLSTNANSSSQIGMCLSIDDRPVAVLHHSLNLVVQNGISPALNSAISAFVSPGVAGNRWHTVRCTVDPDAAPPENRIDTYSFGRKATENTLATAPSGSDPTATLHIGSVSGGTLATAGAISTIVIYKGEWSAGEQSMLDEALDLGEQGNYVVTSEPSNISGQAGAYEAFPFLRRLSNGNLLALWRTAGLHFLDRGTITRAISTDNGETWSKTYDVIEDDADHDLRDPYGIVLPSGRILIANNRQQVSPSFAVQNAKVSYSDDDGATFTLLSTIDTPEGKTYIFPFGEWHLVGSTIIAPMYTLRTSDLVNFSEIWESSDDGVTWTQRSVIGQNLNETSIINLSGSNWLAVARRQTGGTLRYATSTDNCATWGSLVESNLEGVSPCLFRVGDTIYCAVGDRTEPAGIRVIVWSDGRLHGAGKTHLVYQSDEANTDLGYPSVVVDDDEVSAIWFDENNVDPGILFARFKLPDFGSVL